MKFFFEFCFIIISTIWCFQPANAQVIPTTQTQPGNTTQLLNPTPAAYLSGTTLNYVRSFDAEKPFSDDSLLTSVSRTVQEVKQTTQYLDGLGRPIQTVVRGGSPSGKDIVSVQSYDVFGREQFNYMPYVSTAADGNFRANAFYEQNNFLKTMYNPGNDVNGEKFFYAQTLFEASPLNRPLNTFAPGNSWVGNAKGISTQYLFNSVADSVVIWNMSFNSDSTPVKSNSPYYAPGTLYKYITIDEQNHQIIEYKDKDEHIILKKIQISDTTATTAYTGWLSTYYIYDDLGNLRYVIQPLGVLALRSNSWVYDAPLWKNSSFAKGLCFSYVYDSRQRMKIKRIPGAGEVWMVYDARDRLVMSQDSVARVQGIWMYVSFDSLNRPVITGKWTTSGNLSYHQNLASASIKYPVPSGNFTVLTQTWYDDYVAVNTNGSGLANGFITNNTTNTNYFYSASDVSFPYPRAINSTNLTLGMVTGTKVNVVGTNTYLYAVNYYDDRGRLIETQSTNYTGGRDTVTMQYSFSGKLLRTLEAHGKGGANPLSFTILTKLFYDATGRITSTTKKAGSSFEDTIAVSKYNELGQLEFKKIGQKRTSMANLAYGTSPIDSMRYSYNIRGWLTGINKDYTNASNSAVNWFGMQLSYDYGFSAAQLNGNITGIKWRNKGDGAQRAFGFNYDPANRLTKGDFTQYTGSAWNTSANIDFSVRNIRYDANGNILNMNQMGLKLNTPALIDSLLYSYNANSNQLNYVTDRVNDTSARLGDFVEKSNNATQDYWYDGNGNMIQDNNKAIANIRYNYLNLPDSVTVTGKGYIKYVYNSNGTKLQKVTIDNQINKKTVTNYTGSFIYQSTAAITGTGLDTLQYIVQEEGRMRPKSVNRTDTLFYDFFEKDHLGNVRVVLTDEQRQDVYPAATLENNSNAFATEKNYYNINVADTISTSSIASWSSTAGNNYANNNGNPPYNNNPYTNTTNTSTIVYKLNGNTGNKTGLGIALKVMSGDVIDIFGKSFWHSNGTNPNNSYPISAALTGFINLFAGSTVISGSAKGSTAAALNASSITTSGLNSWLNSVPSPSMASVPKAYINWILFDEQFKPVNSGSGFDLVSTAADAVKNHHSTVNIATGGYLYVYCSNESNINVFFDNLQLIHTRGPLLETNDYYPFGLVMSGISSKAAGGLNNKLKYNGKELQSAEFSDGSGLEEYDYGARHYNAQIGRFMVLDRFSEKYESLSPYSYTANNPISNIDVNGDSIWTTIGNTQYYFGNHDGKWGLYDQSGGMYSGDDKWANQLVSSLTELANLNDDVISERFNDVLTSSYKHNIVHSAVGDNAWSDYNKDGKIKNGGDVFWDGTTTYNNRDKRLEYSTEKMAHELLGHGWQGQNGLADLSQIDTKHKLAGFYDQDSKKFTWLTSSSVTGLAKMEVDATSVQNRYLGAHSLKPVAYYPQVFANGETHKLSPGSKYQQPLILYFPAGVNEFLKAKKN